MFDAVYYLVDGNEYKAGRINREKLAALKYYFENCYDAAADVTATLDVLGVYTLRLRNNEGATMTAG